MNLRKVLLQLHLVLGLGVGMFLVSAGLTGSVLVWRHEIDAFLHPELLRVEPGGERIPLEQVIEWVQAAYPGISIGQMRMPRSSSEVIRVISAGEEPIEILVDPYRGEILGSRGETESFANALFHWHTSLLAGEPGHLVAGTAALLVLALVASGLVIWWPGLRRLRDGLVVKWRSNWKRQTFDLHRAGGFWSAVFLVVMAITGSSLIFPEAYMAGLNALTRSPPRPAAPAINPTGDPDVSLQVLVTRAGSVIPGGEVTVVTPPQGPAGPVVVRIMVPEELHPNGRNFIYLHPQTGEVLRFEKALQAPVGTRSYNVLYPIHIGRWGGFGSRVLHSILGFVPLLLFVTGVLMWRNRTRGGGRRLRRQASRASVRRPELATRE